MSKASDKVEISASRSQVLEISCHGWSVTCPRSLLDFVGGQLGVAVAAGGLASHCPKPGAIRGALSGSLLMYRFASSVFVLHCG